MSIWGVIYLSVKDLFLYPEDNAQTKAEKISYIQIKKLNLLIIKENGYMSHISAILMKKHIQVGYIKKHESILQRLNRILIFFINKKI